MRLIDKDTVIELLYRSVRVDSNNKANVVDIAKAIEKLPEIEPDVYCQRCGARMDEEPQNG